MSTTSSVRFDHAHSGQGHFNFILGHDSEEIDPETLETTTTYIPSYYRFRADGRTILTLAANEVGGDIIKGLPQPPYEVCTDEATFLGVSALPENPLPVSILNPVIADGEPNAGTLCVKAKDNDVCLLADGPIQIPFSATEPTLGENDTIREWVDAYTNTTMYGDLVGDFTTPTTASVTIPNNISFLADGINFFIKVPQPMSGNVDWFLDKYLSGLTSDISVSMDFTLTKRTAAADLTYALNYLPITNIARIGLLSNETLRDLPINSTEMNVFWKFGKPITLGPGDKIELTVTTGATLVGAVDEHRIHLAGRALDDATRVYNEMYLDKNTSFTV